MMALLYGTTLTLTAQTPEEIEAIRAEAAQHGGLEMPISDENRAYHEANLREITAAQGVFSAANPRKPDELLRPVGVEPLDSQR